MKRTKDTCILMNWWFVVPFFLIGFTYSYEYMNFRSQLILGPAAFLIEWVKCRKILSQMPESISLIEIKEYYRSDYSHRWKKAKEQVQGIQAQHFESKRSKEA